MPDLVLVECVEKKLLQKVFNPLCLSSERGRVRGHLSMKKIGNECKFFLLRTTIMNYEATERDRSFNAMHLAYTLVDFTNF